MLQGGRYAGSKEMCKYTEESLSLFFKDLKEHKITVSGLQCGKQEINPASQIPLVDSLWAKHFPTENGEIVPCPMFAHSNNQYDSSDLIGCDISLLEDVPKNLKCERIIIAGPKYDNSGVEATFMLCRDQWNGVNHMPIAWDGKVETAVSMFIDKLKRGYREEYAKRVTPQKDWYCVTVDYHS
jgi:hypothetical protein